MSDRDGHRIDIVSSAEGDFGVSPAGDPAAVSSSNDARATDGSGDPVAASGLPSAPIVPERLWIGIRFECCGAYARVYRDADVPWYVGVCPRCRRQVSLRVGPDGINAKFFRAIPL